MNWKPEFKNGAGVDKPNDPKFEIWALKSWNPCTGRRKLGEGAVGANRKYLGDAVIDF